MPASLEEPWRSFLHDLDRELIGESELHCVGGFVIAVLYGLERPTADMDVLEARGPTTLAAFARLAGRHSPLAQRHRVYVDVVTVADIPENYDERLLDILPGEFRHLRLKALEPHDLVLAKLPRNADHDREDVKYLTRSPGLNVDTLVDRYRSELRFKLSNPTREDNTLELWVEMIREVQES